MRKRGRDVERLHPNLWQKALTIYREAQRRGGVVSRRMLADALGVSQHLANMLLWAIENRDVLRLEPVEFNLARKVLVIADLHIPYHDHLAVELALGFGEKEDVDAVVILGDLLDFYQISPFRRAKQGFKPADELQEAYEFLRDLRARFPEATIIYKEGNHESRLQKYIFRNAEKIADLVENLLQDKLQLDKLNIIWKEKPFKIGNLWFLHGHERAGGSYNPEYITNVMWKYIHDNFIVGHFHRTQEKIFKKITGTSYWGGAVGWLGKQLDWAPLNNWTQGFGIIDFDKSGNFRAHLYTILNGEVL